MDHLNLYQNGLLKCPCCGNYTLDDNGGIRFDICSVCFWEDDPFRGDNLDRVCGPNAVSLREARKNYQDFGACERRFISLVRKPEATELPLKDAEKTDK